MGALLASDFSTVWAPPQNMLDMSWPGHGMEVAGVINGGKIWTSNDGGQSMAEVG